ncbi:DNA polymerase delta regulatory subunit B [Encephalitozoon romaleae SJ-2008]|uniref:DNA polymerase delta regulatory subunit B n=1 Tax=Encephalitozoon romaleae (strain SJ-2008) TaxID=1178016 RepID=I6ZKD2_ENCRO|nr:DNA polymerase delta regulatory subunit B [Encephalitozoon romaleae SJ-2008]AFN83733.1 DNA polymerase delta regulatory subunit B [Encephalitozoon romaleae SJ-2008]
MDDLSLVNYEHQFNRTYDARLAELRPYIIKSAKALNAGPILDSILGIEEEPGNRRCVIIGTLFIASDLKPTIFDKINRKSKKIKEMEAKTYYSQEIKYFLEDGSGRVEVEFLDISWIYQRNFVISTGMCIGVAGAMTERTKFLAEDILFPFSHPQSFPYISRNLNSRQRVCFISGPSISNENKNRERMMVIIDYLRMTGVKEYIMIGNFFAESKEVSKQMLSLLDSVLKYAGGRINLIPNIRDFGSRVLPLSPVHPKLFTLPVGANTNPCHLEVDGRKVLITTRFVVEDLLKYLPQDLENVQGNNFEYKMHLDMEKINEAAPRSMSNEGNIIRALEVLMKAGHVCPTAPDTIQSVPFSGKDPFVVTGQVDYLCVGDTDEFLEGQSENGTTLFFTIPRFSERHEVVVLDMETRILEVVRFDDKDFD